MLSVQTSSAPPGEGQSVVPEDLGKQAAEMLLEEIYRVSCNVYYPNAFYFTYRWTLFHALIKVHCSIKLPCLFFVNREVVLILDIRALCYST